MNIGARELSLDIDISPGDGCMVWQYQIRPTGEGFQLTIRVPIHALDDSEMAAWVPFDEALPWIEEILNAHAPVVPDPTSPVLGGHVRLRISLGCSSSSFYWGATPDNWVPLRATVNKLVTWIEHKTHPRLCPPMGGDPVLTIIKEQAGSTPRHPGAKVEAQASSHRGSGDAPDQ